MHLVNCNVVMVGAQPGSVPRPRRRQFRAEPAFQRQQRHGLDRTGKLGDGHFTLATAVASSGAAASPHTGVAGRGITRNPLVSLLLSLTNVRLGYWIRNPRASQEAAVWHKWFPPNLMAPGIRQGLFGSGTTEDAFFIELTDGGHFDNTGLYELIRRRVKIIVLSQGSQDLTTRWKTWPTPSSAYAWISACISVSPTRPIHWADQLRPGPANWAAW